VDGADDNNNPFAQDSLVIECPGNVQNAYASQLKRCLSVTDQRNRFVASRV
jgi:hypothetical protein